MTPRGDGDIDREINANQPKGAPALQLEDHPKARAPQFGRLLADADSIGGRYCEDGHVAGLSRSWPAVGGVQTYASIRNMHRRLAEERRVGRRALSAS